ncbi:MAG: lipoprotein signal peptidase [Gammaproteobacteria bacterium]|nr:lipoprotein signal peptidase [Sideroxydans sp.]MBU3903406.1 lipoprotein signal peptidase [Gammaproteobacteria bacterium]MBU4045401.1 lipoprotein signal peptidase [Gammaproteobacteria bacterium]
MLKRWLLLAVVVIILDQTSKLAISSHFVYGESLAITSFFNLVLAHNTGAAFSFLSEAGGMQRWLFSLIAVVASVWIVWLLRKHQAEKLFALALALILGGALGNLIDRIAYGYVVDFLDFHWAGYHFAAFNVADSAITCGAALLIWDGIRGKKHERTAG